MNIVVTVKQVTDPNIPPADIQLDAEAKRIVSPFGVPPVINGYDANALEAALELREKLGGKVTALGLGDDRSRDALKRAIGMGADNAVLLNDPGWSNADSAGIGRALAAAVRKIGNADLILCGRQASDTDGGQVLHWLAEALGLPCVSPVAKIEEADKRTLVVHRLSDEGYHRLRVTLPALLGISERDQRAAACVHARHHRGGAGAYSGLEGRRSRFDGGRNKPGRATQSSRAAAQRLRRADRR
jgi:electron transfer flavoprotein beta subunit